MTTTNSIPTKPIRTDDDARAYMLATDRGVTLARFVEDATRGWVISENRPCTRCGGPGWLSCFSYIDGGICYKCGGANTTKRVKVTPLKKFAQDCKRRDTAEARRAVKRAAEQADQARMGTEFLAAHSGLSEALETDHRISRDLKAKVLRWGSISEAQIKLAFKLAADAAIPATPKVDLPAGRQVIEGTILSVKESFNDYGSSIRMTVKVEVGGGECLVNGTMPNSLWRDGHDSYEADGLEGFKGLKVQFTAMIEPRDEGFAFFKRPSKASFNG